MSTKSRNKDLEEEVKDLEFKIRELSVTRQELSASSKMGETIEKQELLRRAIEVSSNAVSKVPKECSDRTEELYGLMEDAAKKLRESIKSGI